MANTNTTRTHNHSFLFVFDGSALCSVLLLWFWTLREITNTWHHESQYLVSLFLFSSGVTHAWQEEETNQTRYITSWYVSFFVVLAMPLFPALFSWLAVLTRLYQLSFLLFCSFLITHSFVWSLVFLP